MNRDSFSQYQKISRPSGTITAILLCLLVTELPAGQFRKTGTVGYNFLKVPVTARQMALGEAAGALTNASGIMPLFLNPAVLGFCESKGFGYAYTPWLADISHRAAGTYFSLGQYGSGGISLNYFDYGTITKTTHGGNLGEYRVIGNYTAQSLSLGVTYARRLTDRFAYGTRLHYVKETIDVYSSDNLLLDMGIFYHTGFNSLRLGGFISNFGVDARFIGDYFKMPTELHLSLAYDLIQNASHLLTLTTEVSHPSDNLEQIHTALEYRFAQHLYLRSGYKFGSDEDNFACGGGLSWQGFLFDVAFLPFGRFPGVFCFTFQKEFNR